MRNKTLDFFISSLNLSVRSYNCLEAAGIRTVRDLVQKSEPELLSYRDFGKKCLLEIKEVLRDMNLRLSMNLSGLSEDSSSSNVNIYPLFNQEVSPIELSEPEEQGLKDIDIALLGLNSKLEKTLSSLGCKNVHDLLHTDPNGLLLSCGLTIKSVNIIKKKIAFFLKEIIRNGYSGEICCDILDCLAYLSVIRESIFSTNTDESSMLNKRWKGKVETFTDKEKNILILWFGHNGESAKTLEAIGAIFKTSKERIRQIKNGTFEKIKNMVDFSHLIFIKTFEKRINEKNGFYSLTQDTFEMYLEEIKLFNVLLAKANRNVQFDAKILSWVIPEVVCLTSKIEKILKNEHAKSYLWSEMQVNDFANQCSKKFRKSVDFFLNIFKHFIFKRIGQNFFYKEISPVAVCEFIIKKNFPEGLQLSKERHLFLSAAKKEGFSDFFNGSFKRLTGIINRSHNLLLWGWGVYIHRSNININMSALSKIKGWLNEKFDTGQPSVSIWGALKQFRNECKRCGIYNEHALYTCMKMEYSNEFYFSKDPYVYPVKKRNSSRVTKVELIEKYLKTRKGVVTDKEIAENIGLKQYQIEQISSDKIIHCGLGRYMHASNVRFNKRGLCPKERKSSS